MTEIADKCLAAVAGLLLCQVRPTFCQRKETYFPPLYVFQNLNIFIQYGQISQQVSRRSFEEKRGSCK